MNITDFLPSSLMNPARAGLDLYIRKDDSDAVKQKHIYKEITADWNYDFSFNPLKLIAKLACANYFYTAGQFLIDTFIQREIKQVKAEEFPKILKYMTDKKLFDKELTFHEKDNLEHRRKFLSKDNVALFRAAGLELQAYAGMSLEEALAHARAHVLFEAGADEDFREFLRLDKQDAASLIRLTERAKDLSYDQCDGTERNLFLNILFEKSRLGDNWKKAIKALPKNEQALLLAFSNPAREKAFLVDAFLDSERLRRIKPMFLNDNPDIQFAIAKRLLAKSRENPAVQRALNSELNDLVQEGNVQVAGIDILKETLINSCISSFHKIKLESIFRSLLTIKGLGRSPKSNLV